MRPRGHPISGPARANCSRGFPRSAIVAQPHARQSALHAKTMPLGPGNRGRIEVRNIPEDAPGAGLGGQSFDKCNPFLGTSRGDGA